MSSTNCKTIVMRDISKFYQTGEKQFKALKNINLELEKGELAAVVGKSGSGKSTLLNILGGIDKPTSGCVTIAGRGIGDMGESRLSRIRGENLGFVFQFFQLMPTLTILENILMPMDFVKRIPAGERRKRAEMLLDRVGILDHASKFPASLSGGEQQRAAIARALANDPPIILADEPTGNLDSRTSEDIFNLLESLTKEGKTVLMVTHNDELAGRCGRLIRIHDGEIVEDSRAYRRKAGSL